MGIFGPKGARLVFSCVSAVGATKFAPQAEWDLQYSADALTADELRSRRLTPASTVSTPADEMTKRNKKNPNDIQVPVFYATNREPLSASDRQRHPRKFFGQVGKTTPGLNVGLGRVRIREDAFKLANLQDERDARRLEEIAPCKDEAEWKRKLREALNGDVKKSIIVFVHGCFTDFPRGLEYGGLVKHGCNFSGPMVVFSWPSIGHKVQNRPYAKDEKSVKWSVPHLKEFLRMLLTEFEAKVHVLSYSMGARVVIGALDALEEEILALDEKLKHESTHLRAKLRDKFRGVVTRGEEAAAGVKVGVRELGNILARERDLLQLKAASLHGGALALSDSPQTDSPRVPGFGEGLARSTAANEARSGVVGEGLAAGSGPEREGLAVGAISEERAREWEALRGKLGHLIFMAPDEEVEKFQHTARRWTQSLRERVSGQIQGASEEVKQRVRSSLRADGPEAIEEAAKRGVSQSDDVTLAAQTVGRLPGIPPRSNPPASLRSPKDGGKEKGVSSLSLSLPHTDFTVTPRFSAWQDVLGGSRKSSPPELELPGTPTQALPEKPRLASPTPSLATILSGKVLDLNPDEFAKPDPEIVQGSSQTELLKPTTGTPEDVPFSLAESMPVTISPGGESPPDDDVFAPSSDVISPGASEKAFFIPTTFQGPGSYRPPSPSVSSTSSRTPSRSSSSTDLVGEELQQALLWEHLHAAASEGYSDHSSDVSSRASSRVPSRTPSIADLGSTHSSFSESVQNGAPFSGDELGMPAGGRQLTAGVSGTAEAVTSHSGIMAELSGSTAGIVQAGLGGTAAEVSGSPAGAGEMTVSDAAEKALWRRRKSLPAMGLHLSSSAPVLSPASLEWRVLHSLPLPTAAARAPESSSAPSAEPPTSDDVSDVTGPRFSLYTSQSDWALKLAGLATTKPWARGLARMVAFGDPGKNDLGRRVGATLLVEDGYETIDATEVSIGSRNMGHHYLFHRCILEDITHLLSGANTHKRRFEATTPDGRVYWKIERGDFKPAAAPTPALYPTWSTVHMETAKVAPAERQMLYFASDDAAINFNY